MSDSPPGNSDPKIVLRDIGRRYLERVLQIVNDDEASLEQLQMVRAILKDQNWLADLDPGLPVHPADVGEALAGRKHRFPAPRLAE